MVTPHEQYSKMGTALGRDDLYFKREDLHPYGSHKGRSIPVMIDHYYKRGDRHFAISSSGNAALAAALHIKELPDATLDIFVGNNIMSHKLDKVRGVAQGVSRIQIQTKERPLQALAEAMTNGARSLRQSTDDFALTGYETLAREIAAIPKVGAVFIGTSSGTTAQALAQYFLKEKLPVQVHIVQTSSCHPMSESFAACEAEEEPSVADAIVDRTALRKPALIPLIKKTGGAGWCGAGMGYKA